MAKEARGGRKMDSVIAAAAIGEMMMGAGGADAPAEAAIAPRERTRAVQLYRIPAGSIASALNVIADENDLHVLYDARVTQGLRTSGLTGAYTIRDALGALLAGTRLTYAFSSDGRAVSIVLAQAENGVRSDAAEALPAIDIGAERPATGGEGGSGLTPRNSYVTPVVSVGTKTDTPVMNTPVNVQAVTQKALEDQQAINLSEALRNVSGVFVATGAEGAGFSRSSGIYTRGFRSSQFYRDGFRIDRSSNIDTIGARQLGNVSSIEVLKGPDAILYGLSEPGGIVNVTTAEPQESPHYSINQQIGSLSIAPTSTPRVRSQRTNPSSTG